MQLVIMGPPGAGKGTQATLIAEHYAIPAISTGDMFRAMKTADTPLARQVREIMESGGYVSDEITNAIVADRLGHRTASRASCLTVIHVPCSKCRPSTTISPRPSDL
jgi:adenylate kinase family enzyme